MVNKNRILWSDKNKKTSRNKWFLALLVYSELLDSDFCWRSRSCSIRYSNVLSRICWLPRLLDWNFPIKRWISSFSIGVETWNKTFAEIPNRSISGRVFHRMDFSFRFQYPELFWPPSQTDSPVPAGSNYIAPFRLGCVCPEISDYLPA